MELELLNLHHQNLPWQWKQKHFEDVSPIKSRDF